VKRLPGVLVMLLGLLAGPVPAQQFRDTPAYHEMRRAGLAVLAERELDIAADARSEVVVAERGPAGIGLSAWSRRNTGLALLGRVPPRPADELVKLEVLELEPGQRALWFETSEQNPDEDDHLLTLHRAGSGGLQTIFSAAFRVVHPEDEAGRPARRLVEPASGRVGVVVLPREHGWPRLRLRRDAKLLRLVGGGGRPLWLLAGIREDDYLPERESYRLAASRFVDFLVPLPARRQGQGRVWNFILPPGQSLRLLRLTLRVATPTSTAGDCLAGLRFNAAAAGRGRLRLAGGSVKIGGALAGAGEFTPAGRALIRQLLVLLQPPLAAKRLQVRLEPASGADWPSCLEKLELLRDRPAPAAERGAEPKR